MLDVMSENPLLFIGHRGVERVSVLGEEYELLHGRF